MSRRVVTFAFLALAVACIALAAYQIFLATRLRTAPARVVASRLVIDWADRFPVYTLQVELRSEAPDGRTIYWEGDPGRATYPEEALDHLDKYPPGRRLLVSNPRGKPREVRFQQPEASPEYHRAGLAFSFAVLFVLVAAVYHRAGFGFWLPLGAIGVWLLLLLPYNVYRNSAVLGQLAPIAVRAVGAPAPFRPDPARPNVEVTSAAAKRLADTPYQRYEFTLDDRTLHLGSGPWEGEYDPPVLRAATIYLSREDRWDLYPDNSWSTHVLTPLLLQLVVGLVFTGGGWVAYHDRFRKRF